MASGTVPACHLVNGIENFSTDPSLDPPKVNFTPCLTAADCPGENNDCSFPACISGKCTTTIVDKGTAVKEQVAADCKVNECDGAGTRVDGVVDPTDILDDGKECTVDECSAMGEPTNAPAAAGTSCAMGTMFCNGKGACVECAFDTDCTTMGDVCSMDHCVPKVCVNQMQDMGESDVDCGGTICQPCGTGLSCAKDTDCQSKFCKMGQCAEPSCTDQIKNGDETDSDCGGNCPMDCADGLACLVGGDCTSKVCTTNVCQAPTCNDGVQNGPEIGVDCGQPCGGCGVGTPCTTHMDCASEFCRNGLCTSIIQVAAGTTHACAVVATNAALNNGEVFCWGGNNYGELGAGSVGMALSRPTPLLSPTNVTSVSTFSNSSAMAASGGHTCARHLASGGVAKFSCWGRNDNGQLGNNTKISSIQPIEVTLAAGAEPIQVIAGGRHTCAITKDTHVQCWGANGQGQLGNNSTMANFTTPQAVTGSGVPNPLKATQLALGTVHSCARTTDAVYCWGDNEHGQVGINALTDQHYPRKLNLTGVTQLSAGQDFTCGLVDQSLFCWGDNSKQQLGSNGAFFAIPTAIQNVTAQSLPLTLGAAGSTALPDVFGGHSCFVLAGGKLVCLGFNDHGQLGIGNTTNTSMPTEVTIEPVKQVSLGTQFSCAILEKGTLQCWGRNDTGQLGTGDTNDSNVPIPVKWPDP